MTHLTDTTISHRELLNIVIAAWFTPGRLSSAARADNDDAASDRATWGLPILMWDEPGTGKTSALESLGRLCGFEVITIAMNNRQPEDVGGYAIPSRTRDYMVRVADSWVANANTAKRAVVLFDEFTVSPDHQAAALRVFSERMAGETRLRGSVRLTAMANPPSCAATPHDLTPPAANRFGHLTWVGFSADEFGEWLVGGAGAQEMEQIDAAAHESRVLDAWPAAFARAAATVKGYLRRFPADLHEMPQGHGRDGARGERDELRWPSRRVWEMVTRAVASAQIHGLTALETDTFIGAYLPAGIAARFAVFRSELDIAEPADYLDGRVEFEPTAKIDRTFAVMEMTAAYLMPESTPNRLARAAAWWQMAAKVAEHRYGGRDVIVPAARMMAKAKDKGGAGLGQDRVPEAASVITSLMQVLLAEQRAKAR